jgi:hypothetical protein
MAPRWAFQHACQTTLRTMDLMKLFVLTSFAGQFLVKRESCGSIGGRNGRPSRRSFLMC